MKLKKSILFFLLIASGATKLNAQSWNMTCPPGPITINTCTGNFYDSGGPGGGAGAYLDNQNCTYTFCSNQPGQCITAYFNTFNVNDFDLFGNPYDYLNVYDGPTTGSPLLFQISGGPWPSSFPTGGTGGCLTFFFHSDGTVHTAGWNISFDCEPCPIPQSTSQQDCDGAIPVCQEQYNQPFAYSGQGTNPNEINTASSCLGNGEINDAWYVFTAQTSGNFSFNLTPLYTNEDYDFAVYNITNNGCAGIFNGSSPEISCNYSSNITTWAAQTGANSSAPYNGTGNSNGALGNPFNASAPVIAGNTYVINVSNYTGAVGGYYLDLSPSSASLFDNVPPSMTSISTVSCGSNSVIVNFSEPVLCSSIQGADFTITGPGGTYTVVSATGTNCTGAGIEFTSSVTITVTPSFSASGTYNVNLVGAVTDLCNNVAPPASFPFSLSTVSNAGVDQNVCGLTATLAGNNPSPGTGQWIQISSSSGGTSVFGNQNNQNSTVTVSLAGTYVFQWGVTIAGCTVYDQVQIVFLTPPSISASASPSTVCKNSPSTLTATGGISYTWAPNTNISATTGSSVTATPSANITYTVIGTNASGCTASTTVAISTLNIPTLGGNATSASCGLSNGLINLIPGGVGFPFTYLWSNGVTVEDLGGPNAVAAGTYSVTVTNSWGCSASTSFTVNAVGGFGMTYTQVNTSCPGGVNGSINISLTGSPGAGMVYTWNTGATTQDISGIGSGTYTVSASDVNGCTANATITITSPPPIIPNFVVNNVSCAGGSNGNINMTTIGGTAPYTFHWSNNSTTEDINSLAAGIYVVTITDAVGCSVSPGIIITDGISINSSTTHIDVNCFGAATGSIDLSVTGGTVPYSYQWSNGATVEDISNLFSGTYTVTVTDANGCTGTVSTTILQPTPINFSDVITNTSCGGALNGAIDITVSGGSAPYTFLWSNGATTEDISSLGTGNYSVTILDAFFCSYTWTGTVSAGTGFTLSTTHVNATCGQNNGSINLTVTGGVFPFSFQWINGATTEDINGLNTGGYIVTVTDAAGCSATLVTLISNSTGPTLSSTLQNILCNGSNSGGIDLSLSGGTSPFNYNWSNGLTTQDITGLTAGNYSVTVADANGCSATLSSTVTQPAPIQLSETHINTTCGFNNGSIDLSVSGGISPYTYIWSNSSTQQDVSAVLSGNYSVTVTDFNGCTSSLSATIMSSAAPVISSSQINVLCNSFSTGSIDVTISGGIAPYNYIWSNGATTEDLTNLLAGNYSLTVLDANSCADISIVTISEPPLLSLSETHTIATCGNSNGSIDLTVSGGTNPLTYLWSTGATTQDISNLSPSTYTVTVTDGAGCTAGISVSISASGGPSLSVSQTNVSCFGGTNGSINLTVAGGALPFSYLWSNGATTANISNLILNIYSVTVTDANSCTASISANISQPVQISLIESHVNSSCGNNNGSIDITATGGTIPYSYLWSNAVTTEDLSGITPGNFSVTVTDANSCTAALSINISNNTGPSLNTIQTNVQCHGGSNGSIDLSVLGGTLPLSYNWSNSQTTQDLSNLSTGSYSVTVNDANNCSAVASINISEPSALTLSETHVDATCGTSNGSVDLTVTGGTINYSYLWNNASTTQDLSGINAGSFTVTVTDGNGCTSTLTSLVSNSGSLSATLIGSNVTCFGANNGSVDLTPSGGAVPYSYSWSNGFTTQDISNLAPGNYTVTVTDNVLCQQIQNINITEPALLQGTTIITNATCGFNNGSIDLTPLGGVIPYNYQWSNGMFTEDILNLSAGNFSFTITDANMCTASGLATVNSIAPPSLYVAYANVTCNSGSDGSIDLSVIGGTANFNFQWSNSATTEDLQNLSAGNYYVTVTDANNCSVNTSVVISEPSAFTVSEVHSNASCGLGNGGIDLTIGGASAPYSFIWNNASTTEDLSNIFSGNYSVTISDGNGCTSSFGSVFISGSTVPTLSEIHIDANCGQANGSIDLNVVGNSPFIFLWNNAATTEDINSLIASIYSVTVSDINNCSATLTVNIQNSNGPNLSETHIDASCGNNNGSINLTVAGGISPYSYVWSNAATTQDIINLAGGNYIVTVTDQNNCTASASVTIQSTSGVSLISVPTEVTCFGFSDGSIDLTVSTGSFPFTYNWNNGFTTEDLSGLGGGNYDVTVTDANNCTASASVFVIEHAQLTPSETHINETCGLSNGSIDLSVIGGYQPYGYSWSNGATTQDIQNITSGNYTVTVTDQNVCTITYTVSVSGTAGPITSIVSSNISCNGNADGFIDLTVNSGIAPYSYIWNNANTTQDISNLTSGNYSVTISDANNCTSSTAATISEPAILQLSETHVNASCGNSGSINITPTGGTIPYNYNWSNSSTTEDLSSLSAANYDLTVTDANNCSATISISILNAGGILPLSSTFTNETCTASNGAIDLNVNGGTAPFSFNWSNAATTEDLSNIPSGIYDVTVSDATGCSGVSSITITNYPAQTLSETHTNATCGNANGSIDLSTAGGTSPLSFIWSNAQTTEDISSLSSGNFSVTVNDANFCSATLTIQISNSAGPLINETHTDENCNQQNGSIDITVLGNSPFVFSWSNGFNTEDIQNLSAGTYSVTVTDANSCTSALSIIISNIPGPSLSETHISTSCGINNGSIDLSVSGGSSPLSYLWSNGFFTQDLLNQNAGTYNVTVTDAGGCTAALNGITLNSSSGVLANSVATSSTCGNPNGSIDLTITQGVSPYTFLWNNALTTEDIQNLSAGNYSVTITDATNCSAVSLATVSNIAGPQISLAQTPTTCGNQDGSIDLTVNGGTMPYNYQWSNVATTEDLSQLAGGFYYVTVTDGNNCSAIDSIAVVASTYPIIIANVSPDEGCAPLNVFFDNQTQNAVSYVWSFGDGTTSNTVSPNHTYNNIGFYPITLIAVSATGCADTMQVDTVNIYPTPVADFISEPWMNEATVLSLAEYHFTNLTTNASSYWWTFGDGGNDTTMNPVYHYQQTGEYYVTLYAYNPSGCADTISYGPMLVVDDIPIFIPNTFTPNGDHKNDIFKIYGTGISSYHLWIYDRWGELLFESDQLFPSWDGTYKGQDLNTGVYVYQVDITMWDATHIIKKGDVTLFR